MGGVARCRPDRRRCATYCSVFFTDAGVLRTRLATNAAIKRMLNIVEVLQGEADRLDACAAFIWSR